MIVPKSWSGCILLCVFVPVAHVSSFALNPAAMHGNIGLLLSPRKVSTAASLSGRPVSMRRQEILCAVFPAPSVAVPTDRTKSCRMTASDLARRTWEHLATLMQAFLLKVAVLLSLFAAPAWARAVPPSAAEPTALEAPAERPYSSFPNQMLGSNRGMLAFIGAVEGREETAPDSTAKKEDLARQFEEAEGFSRDRKNWLYSQKAQQVGMTILSAASLSGLSHVSESSVLVAKAEQLQQPNDHAAEAMRLTTAAASELSAAAKASISNLVKQAPDVPAAIASMTPDSAKKMALQTSEAVRATSNTVTVRVSDLLREHDSTIKAVSAKLESATSALRASLKTEAREDASVGSKDGKSETIAKAAAVSKAIADAVPMVSSNGNVPASKSWSAFRGTEAFLAEEAKASKNAASAAGDAFLGTAPSSSQAELQAQFPNWQKITRKQLLEMDFKHHHHDSEEPDAPAQARDFLAKLVAPLTMGFGFIKLMFPLTMLSVPVIWVFPWELLTGGFKSSRKFFNDAPGSREEELSANRFREKILWASTILNVVVSVIFGSGGGGGGHH